MIFIAVILPMMCGYYRISMTYLNKESCITICHEHQEYFGEYLHQNICITIMVMVVTVIFVIIVISIIIIIIIMVAIETENEKGKLRNRKKDCQGQGLSRRIYIPFCLMMVKRSRDFSFFIKGNKCGDISCVAFGNLNLQLMGGEKSPLTWTFCPSFYQTQYLCRSNQCGKVNI